MIDEWIVFRWKRVYPADVFLKFPADDWEKELIETFAGYSHEGRSIWNVIGKKTGRNFNRKQRNLRTGAENFRQEQEERL